MTADLIRKYPDRFLYGSDQLATSDFQLLRKSYDAWAPLWQELGPELPEGREGELRRVFDQSRGTSARGRRRTARRSGRGSYSSRNAVTGSSVAARCAGSRLAAAATAARASAARTIVTGSLGPRP